MSTKCVLACLGAGAVAAAGAADLRADFSLASNPNGDWAYGSSVTLGGFTAYTNNTAVSNHYLGAVGTSGLAGWSNNTSPPIPYVAKNLTAQTYFQNWHPTDVLFHPRFPGILTIARWTAPSSTPQMSIAAIFRRIEDVTSNPSTCYVLKNGTILDFATIVAANETHKYGAVMAITAGDQIDFVVGAFSADAGTGVVVDGITTVVPEPATGMVLASLLALGAAARKRRR